MAGGLGADAHWPCHDSLSGSACHGALPPRPAAQPETAAAAAAARIYRDAAGNASGESAEGRGEDGTWARGAGGGEGVGD